ncbi:uncharacterized protein SPSK_06603 [Sporothrix schenckii 1099-18]|uniref:Uncharacterized protein n=1 Tax=Sporothrix schenckii 1099-18 TaxID=1397361 RepID=A0A0F2MKE6_SPOSC|nr:uncharacterized protein SPSK_06603 [Sporothrix schenckii 1099-18]KJR89524.1 hypothetical protein SPSK_06603 [Sporothrix schenckii 1099-18]
MSREETPPRHWWALSGPAGTPDARTSILLCCEMTCGRMYDVLNANKAALPASIASLLTIASLWLSHHYFAYLVLSPRLTESLSITAETSSASLPPVADHGNYRRPLDTTHLQDADRQRLAVARAVCASLMPLGNAPANHGDTNVCWRVEERWCTGKGSGISLAGSYYGFGQFSAAFFTFFCAMWCSAKERTAFLRLVATEQSWRRCTLADLTMYLICYALGCMCVRGICCDFSTG